MSLLYKYAPRSVAELAGQPSAVAQLQSFADNPYPCAMLFHGPTGVGKTAAAKALANDLGCDQEFPDLGGLSEIPSGKQDGRAVEELLRSLIIRPMYGSGWKVAIVNEADNMTTQAEAIWLDGLEHLPRKSVVVFTTNNIEKLSDRFVGRCEIVPFFGSGDDLIDGMESHIRRIFKGETGRHPRRLPRNLGRYELASDDYSIRLAVQQITPYIRSGERLPTELTVPFIRTQETIRAEVASAAARKAWQTRRAAIA